MSKRLALLHTTSVTVPAMKRLTDEYLPDVRVVNLLDDSLLADVIASGGITAPVEARMRAYVQQAAVAGASGVLCCCSSVGEVAERLRSESAIPIWRIDEPMAEEAVRLGTHIGVIATVETTLGPTARLIERKAALANRPVTVEALAVAGAFAALQSGRGEEHDRLVLTALEGLLSRSDVVVLAQASMSRLADTLAGRIRIPILTSPVSGLRSVAQLL